MPRSDAKRTSNILDDDPQLPAAPATLAQVAGNIYGQLDQREAGKKVANPYDIDAIWPDPSQPRRTLPSQVRQFWNGTPANLGELFSTWRDLVQQERTAWNISDIFNLRTLTLEGEYDLDDVEQDYDSPQLHQELNNRPLELHLTHISRLARNIYFAGGLNDPIQIDRQGILEYGERRWLAYHLLRHLTQKDKPWSKIPAYQVDQRSRLRQAQENGTHLTLNAISKARQLALLIMELNSQDYSFETLDYFLQREEPEQAYYAQASDGRTIRLHRLHTNKIVSAMGLSHPVQIRQYRALLRLPEIVWTTADDYNLTESALRPFTNPELTEDEIIQYLTDLIDKLSIESVPATSTKPTAKTKTSGNPATGHLQKLQTTFNAVVRAAPRIEPDQLKSIIAFYRQAADTLEQKLTDQ